MPPNTLDTTDVASRLGADAARDDVHEAAASLGRRRFLQGVGAAGVGAAVGTGALALDGSTAAGLDPEASRYVALPKAVRAIDTRSSGFEYRRLSDRHLRLRLKGRLGVPRQASAVVINLVGIARSRPSWLVAYPDGAPLPKASNVNMTEVDLAVANMATVKLGNSGIDLATNFPSDVVVDVLGYYEPVTGPTAGGRFVPLNTAVRALDTRNTPGKPRDGSFTAVDTRRFGIPSHASAVIINLTAAHTTARGWFSAVPWSTNGKPTTSTLNVRGEWDVRAVNAIVPLSEGSDGRFKVYALRSSHIIVDIVGYFTSERSTPATDGLYVPITPTRLLDTRWPGHPVGRLWPKWIVEVGLTGRAARASSVLLNVTGVQTRGVGYCTVSPARLNVPNTSNVNWRTEMATVPNHVITRISSAGFQIFTSSGAHFVADLQGFFIGNPLLARRAPYRNPPPPPVAPPWTLRVPRLGLVSTVYDGDPDRVTDAGHSWHWTGTGWLQQNAQIGAFAHRTEAGAPYRNIHYLQRGDRFTVEGGGRVFTYEVAGRTLTDDYNLNILAGVRALPGPTFALVACSRPDGTPTSLDWRLIVIGKLVSWREV